MSEHTTAVKYKVDIEGSEESIEELQGVLRQTGQAIRFVTSLDYAFSSWQRTAQQFNITNFARSVLSTISLIQTLISITKAAEAAQHAYNAALAITRVLQGPYGWAILAGAGVGIGLGAVHAASTPPPEAPYNFESIQREAEQREREQYRASESER